MSLTPGPAIGSSLFTLCLNKMPREIHSLTDATQDSLSDHVKKIADAWNKSQRHVYKILGEEINDPFAVFLSLYRAACKAGISTSHWDAELEFTRQRFISQMAGKELAACFSAKVRENNRTIERYMDATADGEFTVDELDEIENMLIAECDAIKLTLRGIKIKREKIEQHTGPRLVG